jgi:hypothetical protein
LLGPKPCASRAGNAIPPQVSDKNTERETNQSRDRQIEHFGSSVGNAIASGLHEPDERSRATLNRGRARGLCQLIVRRRGDLHRQLQLDAFGFAISNFLRRQSKSQVGNSSPQRFEIVDSRTTLLNILPIKLCSHDSNSIFGCFTKTDRILVVWSCSVKAFTLEVALGFIAA